MIPLDYFAFFRELPRAFPQIGAMAPSSIWLGKSMSRPIQKSERPLSILEVGPGTGPITRQILKRMRSEDRLTICEVNPNFLSRLKSGLRKNTHFQRNEARIEFFEGPVQRLPEAEPGAKFDVIISSVPFSNFTGAVVEDILATYREMLTPEGCIVFCEYIGARRLATYFTNDDGKARIAAVDDVIHRWCSEADMRGSMTKRISLLNVPPAYTIELAYH